MYNVFFITYFLYFVVLPEKLINKWIMNEWWTKTNILLLFLWDEFNTLLYGNAMCEISQVEISVLYDRQPVCEFSFINYWFTVSFFSSSKEMWEGISMQHLLSHFGFVFHLKIQHKTCIIRVILNGCSFLYRRVYWMDFSQCCLITFIFWFVGFLVLNLKTVDTIGEIIRK